MTLWQKDSKKKDALYVDIFKNHDSKELTTLYDKATFLKNYARENAAKEKTREMAIKGRLAGNVIFAQKKYSAAMKQYNMALCFAIDGSEEMALIYANRSACFYKLNMFDKCLIDIELAKKARYPQNLLEKLNKRKEDVDEIIAKGVSFGYDPKLSYDASEQIPVMANAVKIDIDEHGRRVVATKDLSVGEIILCEPLYVGQSIGGEYTCCNICLKDNENLIPCKKCLRAMFCYGGCENNTLHRLECDIRDVTMQTSFHETNSFHSIIRTILMAIELFPTIDDLMEFVEQNLPNKVNIPQFTDEKAKYRTFLHLLAGTTTPITMQLVYCTYQTMLGNSEFAKMFSKIKYRRFLMHLILHHDLALKNSSLVLGNDVEESTKKGENMAYYYGLTYRLFNHSCVPNVALFFCKGSSFGVIIRPVKENEELSISIIGPNPSESSYNERQALLIDRQIQCECELCQLRLETLPKDTVLKEDMEYLTLIIRSSCYVGKKVTEQSAKIGKVDYETFLQEYGRRPWGEELRFLTKVYHCILMTLFTGRYQE